MELAHFATCEHFAQEARKCALRCDQSGYARCVSDVCADRERRERKRTESRHWFCRADGRRVATAGLRY